MNPEGLQHVTIIGVGLLGGSVSLALKAGDPSIHVAGVGRRHQSLQKALESGVIDSAHLDPAEPAAETDLVVLAAPVRAFPAHLEAIAPRLPARAWVTDVGSTKAQVVAEAERILGPSGPFVGSHPVAGSDRKGAAYSRADLFEGATCILTPTDTTPPELVDRTEALWRSMGMRIVRMSPHAHDRALARVSHLPHLLAAVLMLLPTGEELDLSGSGFADTTRLAGGDPEMWRDIALTNGPAILDALEGFSAALSRLREQIATADADAIETFLTDAQRRRRQATGEGEDMPGE